MKLRQNFILPFWPDVFNNVDRLEIGAEDFGIGGVLLTAACIVAEWVIAVEVVYLSSGCDAPLEWALKLVIVSFGFEMSKTYWFYTINSFTIFFEDQENVIAFGSYLWTKTASP